MDDKACLISRLVISVVSMSVCVYSLIQIIRIHRMDKKRNEAFNISCKKIEACMRNDTSSDYDSYNLTEEEKKYWEDLVKEENLTPEIIVKEYSKEWYK